jgi:hypothetical protein
MFPKLLGRAAGVGIAAVLDKPSLDAAVTFHRVSPWSEFLFSSRSKLSQ